MQAERAWTWQQDDKSQGCAGTRMNIGKNGGETAEPGLVKLYMDMTGSTESQARSVFMLVTVGQNGEREFREAGPGLSFEQPWNWGRNAVIPATQSRLAAPMNVLPLSIPQGASYGFGT